MAAWLENRVCAAHFLTANSKARNKEGERGNRG
jgi:hypothetical protein